MTAPARAPGPAPGLAPGLAPARPVRGAIFLGVIYAAMLPVAILWLPAALASREGALAACHAWCRLVRWAARTILGLETEVRGTPPTGDVLVVAKHQSFLDVILIFGAVPRGRFVMKRELARVPIIGWLALHIGCIPVDRDRRGQAMRKLLADEAAGRDAGGQLIIYPQGTRVPPGAAAPYRAGTGALYLQMGQPAVPVACNVGLFWPRSGVRLRPGRAVVEFLDEIPPGLPLPEVMARIQSAIEPASDRLMAEAGFAAPAPTTPGSR